MKKSSCGPWAKYEGELEKKVAREKTGLLFALRAEPGATTLSCWPLERPAAVKAGAVAVSRHLPPLPLFDLLRLSFFFSARAPERVLCYDVSS